MHDLAQTTRITDWHFFDPTAVEALIRGRATSVYEPENDLLAAVNEKLLWSLRRFDPARGRAFAFVSWTMLNTLCTRVTYQRKW